MSDWTSGYVADIGYTYGYYPELNPLRAKLAFIGAGLVCPEFGTACELGFGQGLSANLHAAASTTAWYGTDFNPSQAGFAQELATASGAPAHLYDEAFAEFANRKDLPDFDYIGLHGIWSWISDENRAVIVDFVRRKLKVGGVLYISYNTLPGWSSFAPMRHLMTEHARLIGAEGQGIVNRINGAIDFSDKLIATNPAFSRANTQVQARLQKVKDMSRHYLAHEYFNRDWHPMYFSKAADWFAQAKLNFACSANLLDHVDIINLTPDQQKFLRDIPDPEFRESVRDFISNQQFRRDFWVKGPRTLGKLDRDQSFAELRVMLMTQRADIPTKINGGLGELTLKQELYEPVLDVLADNQPRTVRELAQAGAGKGITLAQLHEILLILGGSGQITLVQDEAVIAKARQTSAKLNTHLLQKARHGNDISFLASPVTGGGVAVSRFQQLFLLARASGHKTPDQWANYTWQVLFAQEQRIIKEGKTLHTKEENLAELTRQATLFEEKMIPVLKIQQIV